MKAILRELEMGVRCEGEITPKRENPAKTLEEVRVCVFQCVCLCTVLSIQVLQALRSDPLI